MAPKRKRTSNPTSNPARPSPRRSKKTRVDGSEPQIELPEPNVEMPEVMIESPEPEEVPTAALLLASPGDELEQQGNTNGTDADDEAEDVKEEGLEGKTDDEDKDGDDEEEHGDLEDEPSESESSDEEDTDYKEYMFPKVPVHIIGVYSRPKLKMPGSEHESFLMLKSCLISRYITPAALPARRRSSAGEFRDLQRLQVAHNATAGNASVVANGNLTVAGAHAGFP
ncbi:33dc6cf6-2236-482c-94d0-7cddfb386b66 [Sclerotinia trifoliorum]|uniref:33dc6cf6-2236-482c-94d0-7cddfb386b66 n=1 Tax=Sclerotinia trifoliorum TaxID=28548 RepID=A0A8H2VRW2_9HELO|nr:33dc6cf6-2236-482c-94d0-7cddfb386b66 [Sclerotinia trifoliorum]